MTGISTDREAWRALTGAFLGRFFENEITGGTDDLRKSFFWLIAFLAAPFTFMPVTQIVRYQGIVLLDGPEALRWLSRPDKTTAIVLGMMATGFIAALVWNSLMLERRDGLILGTLPVRGRTVVVAKLSALAAYVFGISAAMHLLSSVMFGVILAEGSDGLRLILLGPVAHFAATVGACAFVFVSVTAIQGVALACAGPAGFRRISPMLQVALVAGLVIAFTQISEVVQGVAAFNRPDAPSAPAPWVLLTPPVWFLGLDEWLLGGAGPVYSRLAWTAIAAFIAVAVTTVVSYAVVYQRVMTRVVEAPEDAAGVRSVSASVEWLTQHLSRTPVRRAAAQFYFASIGRVERLRFVVAVTIGLLCAWIVPALATSVTSEQAPSLRATFALSYAALLLVLIGLRIAISLPADVKASWVMPTIDAPGRVLRSGLWRALFVTAVVPVVAAFAAIHAWLWGGGVAAAHAAVMLAVGTLLVELALWHHDDLSNRRPWRPEHVNLRFWWPVYLFGFTTLAGLIPQLEWSARDSWKGTAAIAVVWLIAAAALRIAHRRPYPPRSFDVETFVEVPQMLKLE